MDERFGVNERFGVEGRFGVEARRELSGGWLGRECMGGDLVEPLDFRASTSAMLCLSSAFP